MSSAQAQIHRYGTHPDQHIQLVRTMMSPAKGTAILVHGGYWREKITAAVMEPMLTQLVAAGWNVANVEYRRGPAHPWPQPEQDVAEAIASIDDLKLLGPAILIGHSVGGQLVLLNANATDGVIALAPVTDVARVHAESLGEDAAQEYFRSTPAEDARLYAAASPAARTVPEVPILIVHGTADDRLPLTHSKQYVASQVETRNIETLFLPGYDHFQVIDPQEAHWTAVLDWMDVLASRTTETPRSR